MMTDREALQNLTERLCNKVCVGNKCEDCNIYREKQIIKDSISKLEFIEQYNKLVIDKREVD